MSKHYVFGTFAYAHHRCKLVCEDIPSVEIAASSASYDLHDKRRVYARNGVQEYISFQMYEQQVSWYLLIEGIYEMIKAEENGITRSKIFTGFWLNRTAF